MRSFSSHSRVPTSRLPGAASSSAAYSERSNVSSLRVVAAMVASLVAGLWSVSRLVQAEDEPGVARAERAGELRGVADLAGPRQQLPAEQQLAALPRGQRGGHVAGRRRQFLGEGPAVGGGLGGPRRRVGP